MRWSISALEHLAHSGQSYVGQRSRRCGEPASSCSCPDRSRYCGIPSEDHSSLPIFLFAVLRIWAAPFGWCQPNGVAKVSSVQRRRGSSLGRNIWPRRVLPWACAREFHKACGNGPRDSLLALIALLVFTKRHEVELVARAEAALPGPILQRTRKRRSTEK